MMPMLYVNYDFVLRNGGVRRVQQPTAKAGGLNLVIEIRDTNIPPSCLMYAG